MYSCEVIVWVERFNSHSTIELSLPAEERFSLPFFKTIIIIFSTLNEPHFKLTACLPFFFYILCHLPAIFST